MQQVAGRPWHRRGIRWCHERCREFFEGGGAAALVAKEARRGHFQRVGRRMAPAEAAAARSRAERSLQWGSDGRLRLVDIGSCGSLFGERAEFEVTALDLCPAHPSTYECDFLKLDVGEPNSLPVVAPSAQGGRGALLRLPARGFDVAVMSCVLSYMPRPELRAGAVAKALQLLAAPGLLLIVDTFTVERRSGGLHPGSVLPEWRRAIEAMGARFLRYELLHNSHALAFASLGPADDDAFEEGRLLPPLRVRLEADMDLARQRRTMRRAQAAAPS